MNTEALAPALQDEATPPMGVGMDMERLLEEYRRRQMLEHLAGPVVSVAVHLVGLALLFLVLLDDTPAWQPRGTEIDLVRPPPARTLSPPLRDAYRDLQEPPARPFAPPVPAQAIQPEGNEGGMEFRDQGEPAMGPLDPAIVITPGSSLKPFASPLRLPYPARLDPTLRNRALRDHGAPPTTEAALLRALRWYKAHQNPDGSWSQDRPVAMAGLALLAFLGHGELPTSEEFGPTVQKAIVYLLDRVGQAEGICEQEYSHGIATYALAEAYAMARTPAIRPVMEQGLRVILDGQRAAGGWDYGFRQGERWDLSVSGWQLQALKAGLVAGAETPGLLAGIEKALAFLKRDAFRETGFAYSNGAAASPSMTGVGTLCLQLFGEDAAPEVKASLGCLRERASVKWRGQVAAFAPYAWYYQTYAMLFAGQAAWKRWNPAFADELVRAQKPDGHWETDASRACDPYLNTGFACLMLESYYRLLGTSREDLRHAHRPQPLPDLTPAL